MPKKKPYNALQMLEAAQIIGGAGSSDELRAAYKILAAGNKELQAGLVSVYTQAEFELSREIAKLRDNDLVTVHKQAAIDRVKRILEKYKSKLTNLCHGLAKVGVVQGKVQGAIRDLNQERRTAENDAAIQALGAFGLIRKDGKQVVRMMLDIQSANNLFSLTLNITPENERFYESPFYKRFNVEKSIFERLIKGAYVEIPSRRLIFAGDYKQQFETQKGEAVDNLNLIEEMAARAIRANVPQSKLPFELSQEDDENVKRIMHNMLGKLTHTFDATLNNVTNQINQAANRAMIPNPEDLPQAQTVSIEAETPDFTDEMGEEKGLSASMKSHIKANPEQAEKEIVDDMANHVKFMRTQYAIGRREQDVLRQKTLAEIAKAEAKGSGSLSAARGLIESIMMQGIVAFEDRSGKRWTLGRYCEMATRTGSRQSVNMGELYSNADADLYYIVPRHSTCPICSKYEGRVYSRSGKNPNYPSLAKAFGKIDPNGPDTIENTYVTLHPNCKHALARWSETTKTQDEIDKMREQSNKPFDVDLRTEQQVKIQKERERIVSNHSMARTAYRNFASLLGYKRVGRYPDFEAHFLAKDDFYKKLKKAAKEAEP